MNVPVKDTRGPNYLELAKLQVQMNYEYVVYGTPTVKELPPGAVMGTWCISVPGKVRYILSREMELAPGVLPGDVARAWVRYNYDLPIKRRRDQKRTFALPIMARRGVYPDGVYLDIRHAYLDILGAVGYDVDYRLGKYLAAHPVLLPDDVVKTKWVYAIIIAMSAGARSRMVIKSKEHGLIGRASFNVFSNPCLYALASEVLASIAKQVLKEYPDQTFYINTDGYIVDPRVQDGVEQIVRAWGFDIREKARGETEIWGVGAWRCGAEKTLRHDSKAQDFCIALPECKEASWLQDHFTFWLNCAKMSQ